MADKKLTAKERKQRAAEKSREAVTKATGKKRRAGRVVTYVDQRAKVKPKKRHIHPAFIPKMHSRTTPLSAEARFEMLRPDCVHPWDWHQLFMDDETLWEMMAEEAEAAVQAGEIAAYPIDGPANVSRRKLNG